MNKFQMMKIYTPGRKFRITPEAADLANNTLFDHVDKETVYEIEIVDFESFPPLIFIVGKRLVVNPEHIELIDE